jgi:hypothetical protein
MMKMMKKMMKKKVMKKVMIVIPDALLPCVRGAVDAGAGHLEQRAGVRGPSELGVGVAREGRARHRKLWARLGVARVGQVRPEGD